MVQPLDKAVVPVGTEKHPTMSFRLIYDIHPGFAIYHSRCVLRQEYQPITSHIIATDTGLQYSTHYVVHLCAVRVQPDNACSCHAHCVGLQCSRWQLRSRADIKLCSGRTVHQAGVAAGARETCHVKQQCMVCGYKQLELQAKFSTQLANPTKAVGAGNVPQPRQCSTDTQNSTQQIMQL